MERRWQMVEKRLKVKETRSRGKNKSTPLKMWESIQKASDLPW